MNNIDYKKLKEGYKNLLMDSVKDCHTIIFFTLTYINHNKTTSQVKSGKYIKNIIHPLENAKDPNYRFKDISEILDLNEKAHIKKRDQVFSNQATKLHINTVKSDIKHFRNFLDKSIYGKTKGRIKQRAYGGLVVEGADTNYHVHGLLGFDDRYTFEYYKKAIKAAWSKIKHSGYIDDIEEVINLEKCTRYILKNRTKTIPFDEALITETIWNNANQKHLEEQLKNLSNNRRKVA